MPALDGLRGVAVLMVFLHHAYSLPLLWSGVDLFFLLSGFLITNILLRDSGRMRFGPLLKRFYLRRAQRILPAYALCLALIALLTHQNWRVLWPFYAFFLQNVPYAFHIIGFGPLVPLWSLAVEQHFYLFWPFLVFFLPRRWLTPTLIGLLLGLPILRALCTPLFAHPEAIYSLTPFRIDTMAAGALTAVALPRWNLLKAKRYAGLTMLTGALLYAALSLEPWFRRGANSRIFNALGYSLDVAVFGGLFVMVLLSGEQDWLKRLFSFAPLRWLGRISYAFYLLHLLFLTRFLEDFGPRDGPPIVFCITVAVATLSWYALEKPILALGGAHRGAAFKASQAAASRPRS